MLNTNQIKALADALAFSSQGKRGLERLSGQLWSTDDQYSSAHDFRTVSSLVRRGYLQLFCRGSVAHITDSGRNALELCTEKEH